MNPEWLVPIYSYHCDTCEHEFELKQGFDSEPLHECPRCRNVARRQFHAVGIIYKGSGFYATDYRNSGGSSSSEGNGPSESAGTPDPTASSD